MPAFLPRNTVSPWLSLFRLCLAWGARALLGATLLASVATAGTEEEWRDHEGLAAVERLRRGVNIGNAHEAPPGTWGKQRYDADDFRAIRAAGFDHVRLPVAWHYHQGPAPEYRVAPEFFQKIDALIEGARRERLAVILNWHHFDRFTDALEPALIDQWHAGWRQIAAHYRRVPTRELVLELLNEPRRRATTEKMNELYPAVIAVLRAEDPKRTILVSPGEWGALKSVPRLRLPREIRNLVVSAHCYEPILFTHQGASWTGPMVATKGIVYPGPPAQPVEPAAGMPDWATQWVRDHGRLPRETNPSSRVAFAEIVASAAEWGKREGRAVHVGEFGVINGADHASRVAYAREMREEMDRHKLAWTWWDWKADFRLARETPEGLKVDAALIEALIPAETRARAKGAAAGGERRGPRRPAWRE